MYTNPIDETYKFADFETYYYMDKAKDDDTIRMFITMQNYVNDLEAFKLYNITCLSKMTKKYIPIYRMCEGKKKNFLEMHSDRDIVSMRFVSVIKK